MSDSHIIIAGQSNALGYLNTGSAPYTPTARVQIWADTNADGVGDAWNYMLPGTNTGTAQNPTVWGPEVEIANRWLADHATGYLWIVKVAKGSTGLAEDLTPDSSSPSGTVLDWSPLSDSREMFGQTTAAVTAAHNNLIGTPYAFTNYQAIEWMQGETDATDSAKASAYATNLANFATAARSAWNAPELVVARITDGPGAAADNLAVRQAQFGDDQTDSQMVSFKTIGFEMQPDNLHYDAVGHISLGDAFYNAFLI